MALFLCSFLLFPQLPLTMRPWPPSSALGRQCFVSLPLVARGFLWCPVRNFYNQACPALFLHDDFGFEPHSPFIPLVG